LGGIVANEITYADGRELPLKPSQNQQPHRATLVLKVI
jgi:hypothetical protein